MMNSCINPCFKNVTLSGADEECTETTLQTRLIGKIRATLKKWWLRYLESMKHAAQIESRIAEIRSENDRKIYYFKGL